jgi:hypothetical protein
MNLKYKAFLLTAIFISIFSLSTTHDVEALNLANTSYDGVSTSTSDLSTSIFGLSFNDDGTIMFVFSQSSKRLSQYSLSTPYDISTASYISGLSNELGLSGDGMLNPFGHLFNDDGTKVYAYGDGAILKEIDLDSAFDISSTSTFNTSIPVETGTIDVATFNDDGTKFYGIAPFGATIKQYDLSTPYDISTMTYDSSGDFSITDQEDNPHAIEFNEDGTKLYILGDDTNSILQYSLSTPYDTSTASYDSISFSVASEDIKPSGLTFNDDYTKIYVLGADNYEVYQYSSDFNPTISTFTPADDATSVSIGSNLVIEFSEAVDIETGNITIYKSSDNSIVETISVPSGQVTGSGTDIITINPSSNLAYGTQYYVQFDSTVFDDSNSNSVSAISDSTTWSFTTQAALSTEENTSRNGSASGRRSGGGLSSSSGVSAEIENLVRTFSEELLLLTSIGIELPENILNLLGQTSIRDLEFGNEGSDVVKLQNLLIQQGYSIPAGATGGFYTQTQTALIQYQSDNNITPASGYFGPITRANMKEQGLPGLWW